MRSKERFPATRTSTNSLSVVLKFILYYLFAHLLITFTLVLVIIHNGTSGIKYLILFNLELVCEIPNLSGSYEYD